MILVTKPVNIPNILTVEGQAENIINQLAYDADSQAKIDISGTIYNHKSVKPVLKKAQHNKCCYCEKDQKDEYGAVEHYRPKSGYKYEFKKNEKLKKPGYYWLGYSWDNFYFVCCACNTAKGNYFPLADETTRAKSHHDSISKEEPYLLAPDGPKNPRAHITFDKNLVRGISEYGRMTIKICYLDRDALNVKRSELLTQIEANIIIALDKNRNISDAQKAKDFLKECQKPQSPFSAAATDFLRPFLV